MKTKLSSEYKAEIARNLEDVKRRMADANRLGQAVTLLCATKTVPAEVINYATQELGVTDIGENRVQELLSKYDELEKENVNIHFIGSLQTNKVKYIIDKVCMIHSVDSVKLAAEIDRQAKKHNKIMDVLVEINIGEEENKGGIAPDELDSFLEELSVFDN
ncbi:MAG: YggS family pyridoxal phosphate enzyme, partial [Clostridia bacterium]|nr:YggS family pyridoxal phosphate enzyme [Clostridia bacterium]